MIDERLCVAVDMGLHPVLLQKASVANEDVSQ